MADGRKPDFDVFAIRERTDGKDVFTKIGVAFKRQRRRGYRSFSMPCPLDGASPFCRLCRRSTRTR